MIIKTWEMKKCIYCDDEFSAENPLDYCRKCYQMDKYELADMLLKQIDELKQQRGYWESKISELFNQTSCAECGNRHKCEIMPKPGEFARINCWFFVKDGDKTKPDVADKDVGNIAEPKHEDCKHYVSHIRAHCEMYMFSAHAPKAKDCKHFEPKDELDKCNRECIDCEKGKHQCDKDSCDQCNECGSIDEPDTEISTYCTECERRKGNLQDLYGIISNQRKEMRALETESNRFAAIKEMLLEFGCTYCENVPCVTNKNEKSVCFGFTVNAGLLQTHLDERDNLKAMCKAYENAVKAIDEECSVCINDYNGCTGKCKGYKFDFERFGDKGGDE